jgi:hypothetical protein
MFILSDGLRPVIVELSRTIWREINLTFYDTVKREWCDEVLWINLRNKIYYKTRCPEPENVLRIAQT